ncbi:MAG: hypothetical protein ACJAX4_002232 [Clostridium sp.]|jgi:hypothetical protein
MIILIIKRGILFSNDFIKNPMIIIKFTVNHYWYFYFFVQQKGDQ